MRKTFALAVALVVALATVCIPAFADSWVIYDDYTFLARFTPVALSSTGGNRAGYAMTFSGVSTSDPTPTFRGSALNLDGASLPKTTFPIKAGIEYSFGARYLVDPVQFFWTDRIAGRFRIYAPQDPDLSESDLRSRIQYLVSSGQTDSVVIRVAFYVQGDLPQNSNVPAISGAYVEGNYGVHSFTNSLFEWEYMKSVTSGGMQYNEYTAVVPAEHYDKFIRAIYDGSLYFRPVFKDQQLAQSTGQLRADTYPAGQYNVFVSDLYITTDGVLLPSESLSAPADKSDSVLTIRSINNAKDAITSAISMGITSISSVQIAQTDRILNFGSDADVDLNTSPADNAQAELDDLESNILGSLDFDGVDSALQSPLENVDFPASAFEFVGDLMADTLGIGISGLVSVVLMLGLALALIGR